MGLKFVTKKGFDAHLSTIVHNILKCTCTYLQSRWNCNHRAQWVWSKERCTLKVTTMWPTFCIRHVQMLFLEWKLLYCDWDSSLLRSTVIQHWFHYNDVIMGAIASQITSLTIVYSIVYSDADQRKHQSSASLAFVRGIHRGPVNSPHKWPVTRKMFPFDDVIMSGYSLALRTSDKSLPEPMITQSFYAI